MYQINIWLSTGTENRSMKNMIEQKHLVPIMAQYTETKKKLLSRELIKLVEGKKMYWDYFLCRLESLGNEPVVGITQKTCRKTFWSLRGIKSCLEKCSVQRALSGKRLLWKPSRRNTKEKLIYARESPRPRGEKKIDLQMMIARGIPLDGGDCILYYSFHI